MATHRFPRHTGRGGADHEEIIRAIEEWNITNVEQPDPHFGGLAPCIFAKIARERGTIKYVVHPFNFDDDFTDGSLIVREFDLWLAEPVWEVLYFIDPDWMMPYEPYMRFFTRLAAYLVTRKCHGFPGHPDSPFEIGGKRLQNDPYPNVLVMTDAVLQKARKGLLKTGYYDNLTPEELDSMGVVLPSIKKGHCPLRPD